MRLPARNIWETRIQCVCSIVSAPSGRGVELWMCANFGQCSLESPRIIINPNRLYPIEDAIRREGRFALNIFSCSGRETILRMIRIRRREPDKVKVLGLPLAQHEQWRIPYFPDSYRTLFCEVEQTLATGDHTVVIARVVEARQNPALAAERPLLYSEVAGRPARHPAVRNLLRWVLAATGARDALRKLLERRRGRSPEPDIARNTWREGGQTEEELAHILSYGASDEGRVTVPPDPPPAVLHRRVGVCVVGTGQWGAFQCRIFSQAAREIDLFVCGRDAHRAHRIARSVGAAGVIASFEAALDERRIEAVSLVVPHHLHASMTLSALARGKHVLVEKPIARSLDEADAMIDAARHAGKILMVAEDMHFRPAIREAARAISRGDVGEPLYFQAQAGGLLRPEGWKADKDLMGGGVLIDIGVHYVRAMRLLMGEPTRVLATRAMQVNTKMSGEDSAQVLFEGSAGWRAQMLLNWAGPRGHVPDILILGDGGALHLWASAPYYDLYPAEERPLVQVLSYVRPRWLAERLWRPDMQRVRVQIQGDDRQGYLGEVREFASAVAEDRPPSSRPEDARRDLEIVLLASRALSSDAWIFIPPCPPR